MLLDVERRADALLQRHGRRAVVRDIEVDTGRQQPCTKGGPVLPRHRNDANESRPNRSHESIDDRHPDVAIIVAGEGLGQPDGLVVVVHAILHARCLHLVHPHTLAARLAGKLQPTAHTPRRDEEKGSKACERAPCWVRQMDGQHTERCW